MQARHHLIRFHIKPFCWDAHVDASCAKVACRLYVFLDLKAFWNVTKKTCFVSINLSYAQSLNTAARLRGMTPQSDHCTQRSTETCSTHYFSPNNSTIIILPSLTTKWTLLNCDDTIFSRNYLNRFAILHDLLLLERDSSVTLRLRHSTVYPIPQIRKNGIAPS